MSDSTSLPISSSSQNLTSSNPELQSSNQWPTEERFYKFLHFIGQGATSKVHAAEYNGKKCAIKIINLENCSSNDGLKEINREIASMKRLKHENIVGYYVSFVNVTRLEIVMDLCEKGSLLDMIKHVQNTRGLQQGVFDEHTIATILKDVLRGLTYIHDNDLVHRDLKCGNLLVRSDATIQIADFGVSAFLNTVPMLEGNVEAGVRRTFVGTPCWMAPEVMNQLHSSQPDGRSSLAPCSACAMAAGGAAKRSERRPSRSERRPSAYKNERRDSVRCDCKVQGYGCKADIWSLGITTIEMATGQAPYARFAPFKVLMMTLQNEPPTIDTCATHPNQYENYGHKFRKFCRACLVKDASQRASTKELLQHSYIKSKAKDREFLNKTLLSGNLPPPQLASVRDSEDEQNNPPAVGTDWDFPNEDNVDEAVARAAKALAINEPGHTLAPNNNFQTKDHIDVTMGHMNAPKHNVELPGDTAVTPSPPRSAPPTGAIIYKITLMKRNPLSNNELQNISFAYVVGQDTADTLANDLISNDLLERSNLLLVAHKIDELVTDPSLKEKCFPLYTSQQNGISPNEAEMQGYAKLSISEYNPAVDKDLL